MSSETPHTDFDSGEAGSATEAAASCETAEQYPRRGLPGKVDFDALKRAVGDLPEPRRTRALERFDKVPSSYRAAWARAILGRASPRQAIKAKCYECVCWSDVVNQVGECTVRTCTLWMLRPYQPTKEVSTDAK